MQTLLFLFSLLLAAPVVLVTAFDPKYAITDRITRSAIKIAISNACDKNDIGRAVFLEKYDGMNLPGPMVFKDMMMRAPVDGQPSGTDVCRDVMCIRGRLIGEWTMHLESLYTPASDRNFMSLDQAKRDRVYLETLVNRETRFRIAKYLKSIAQTTKASIILQHCVNVTNKDDQDLKLHRLVHVSDDAEVIKIYHRYEAKATKLMKKLVFDIHEEQLRILTSYAYDAFLLEIEP